LLRRHPDARIQANGFTVQVRILDDLLGRHDVSRDIGNERRRIPAEFGCGLTGQIFVDVEDGDFAAILDYHFGRRAMHRRW